jgi:hypothetical protein
MMDEQHLIRFSFLDSELLNIVCVVLSRFLPFLIVCGTMVGEWMYGGYIIFVEVGSRVWLGDTCSGWMSMINYEQQTERNKFAKSGLGWGYGWMGAGWVFPFR